MSLTTADAGNGLMSRPLALIAAIVIQVGLLYMFATGIGVIKMIKPLESSQVIFIPQEQPPPPEIKPEPKKPDVAKLVTEQPILPPMEEPIIAPETPITESAGITLNESPPVEAAPVSASLSVLRRTDPAYPAAARRDGIEGTVLLTVVVGADGQVLSIDVARSSGHENLDEAAVSAVKRWRFSKPATSPAQVSLPVSFKLERG